MITDFLLLPASLYLIPDGLGLLIPQRRKSCRPGSGGGYEMELRRSPAIIAW